MKNVFATLMCLAGLFLCAITGATAVQYTIRDLGPATTARAINNNGEVVVIVPSGSTQLAFLWDGTMHALTMPDYNPQGSDATCINDVGQIGGTIHASNASHPTIWQGDQYRYISNAASSLAWSINAINNLGWVVGVDTGDSYHPTTGFVHKSDGVHTNLNSQLGFQLSSANDINDSGVVVGGGVKSGMWHAFAWDAAAGGSEVLDLGHVTAVAINNAGQIVGTSGGYAFLWDGTMHDLGTLPGTSSSLPYDINNNGWVVGSARGTGFTRAFVSDGYTMHDLADLVEGGATGWELWRATGINDAGQIVGSGNHHGKQTAFLLTPVPEPSAILTILLGISGVVYCRRHKP